MRKILLLISVGLLPACSPLPVPGKAPLTGSATDARAILDRSARMTGDPWKSYRTVQVSYDGDWSLIAKQVQPVLVDAAFRKSSVEIYQPAGSRIRQTHTGPGGTKEVLRTPTSIAVRYNGVKNTDPDADAAAALVADAYRIFLFGPSYLKTRAEGLGKISPREIGGERCDGIQGSLRPGFGPSPGDSFIAWIGQDSGVMRRFQFSLEGLESTRGADVEVTFSGHWQAPDGTIWPRFYNERIVRPIPARAHLWKLVSLKSSR